MRAAVVTRHGGPEVFEIQDRPAPKPGPGEVLVDVAVAGLNYRDIYEREGRGLRPLPTPLIAGIEGAGTVVECGPGVTEQKVGDRVAWRLAMGSYAEQVVVSSAQAVPIPDAVSSEVAVASMIQGLTAHFLATSIKPIEPGVFALVHGAAGGLGLLLTQCIKMNGGSVIGITSSPEKAERARAAGADELIGYEGFAAKTRELTDGRGADIVYDGVGLVTHMESFEAVRRRGTVIFHGWASGEIPPFDLQTLMTLGSPFVTQPNLEDFIETRAELLRRSAEVMDWIQEGRLHAEIKAYPLEDAARAQNDLGQRGTMGKLVLTVDATQP